MAFWPPGPELIVTLLVHAHFQYSPAAASHEDVLATHRCVFTGQTTKFQTFSPMGTWTNSNPTA
jgi:hypothetical protein